jgi:hypothetical protein
MSLDDVEDGPPTGWHTLSHNGFSTDLQVTDALAWLRLAWPDAYAAVRADFPENLVFGESGSAWFDTDAMDVDIEWGSWLADALENTGHIVWWDGEPFGEPVKKV